MLYRKHQCSICLAYPVNMIAHSMDDLTATSTFLSFSVLLIAHEETTGQIFYLHGGQSCLLVICEQGK